MKKAHIAAAAIVASLLATAAEANVYDFSFTGDNGVSGSGVLTTGNAGSPFTVTGATGTITDTQGALAGSLPFTITGLSGYAGADNELFVPPAASAGYVDFGGISFTTASGPDFNIGGGGTDLPGAVLNDAANNPVGYPVPQYGSNDINLAITAVPEPATWAVMLVGFGGIGAAIRGKRRRQTAATA